MLLFECRIARPFDLDANHLDGCLITLADPVRPTLSAGCLPAGSREHPLNIFEKTLSMLLTNRKQRVAGTLHSVVSNRATNVLSAARGTPNHATDLLLAEAATTPKAEWRTFFHCVCR
jgi:hypothetical protein